MTSAASIGLGIDVGGTATRWCLASAAGGPVVASGSGPALSGHVYDEATRTHTTAALTALAAAVRSAGLPTAIMAGITGLDADTPQATFFQSALAAAFGLPMAKVVVDNDMGLAYRAAFALGTGILLYSGTGAVACHVTAEGRHVRAGGRGVVIDDAGSGHWIATQALRALFRREDRAPGSGWATDLGRHLAQGLGGADWDAARAMVYASDRGQIAALSRQVALAATEGDPDALAILDAAGGELARLALDLLLRLGPRDVILAGGTVHLHPSIPAAVRRMLPADITVRTDSLAPAEAGARAAASFA
jgi:N-acetylglucosamine kinase-like BadF-type ATPase